MPVETMIRALDALAKQGKSVDFWLRDDDAVAPTPALDALLSLTAEHAIPVTLAVIPRDTGEALARRLEREPRVRIAVHGWSHENHAPAGEKKQELGPHRPAKEVLAELARGQEKLSALYGEKLLGLLVPPWNRVAPEVVAGLPGLGFRAISAFGAEPDTQDGLIRINTHIDPIDWHGNRSLRDPEMLWQQTAKRIALLAARPETAPVATLGLLTHHLVHDPAIMGFLKLFFRTSAGHPACRWISPEKIVSGKAGAASA